MPLIFIFFLFIIICIPLMLVALVDVFKMSIKKIVVSAVICAVIFKVLFEMNSIMSQASFTVLFFLFLYGAFIFACMFKLRKNFAVISTVIGTLFVAFLFTISSIFWTKDTAYDIETIQHLEFGWPITFYTQNQSMMDPPFPYAMGLHWEASDNFNKKNFFSSFAINFSGILTAWLLILFYLKRIDKNKIQNNLLK